MLSEITVSPTCVFPLTVCVWACASCHHGRRQKRSFILHASLWSVDAEAGCSLSGVFVVRKAQSPRSPCDFPVYDYLYSFSSVYPQSPESHTNGSKYQHLSLWSTPYLKWILITICHVQNWVLVGGAICVPEPETTQTYTHTHQKKVTGTKYRSKVSHLAFDLYVFFIKIFWHAINLFSSLKLFLFVFPFFLLHRDRLLPVRDKNIYIYILVQQLVRKN